MRGSSGADEPAACAAPVEEFGTSRICPLVAPSAMASAIATAVAPASADIHRIRSTIWTERVISGQPPCCKAVTSTFNWRLGRLESFETPGFAPPPRDGFALSQSYFLVNWRLGDLAGVRDPWLCAPASRRVCPESVLRVEVIGRPVRGPERFGQMYDVFVRFRRPGGARASASLARGGRGGSPGRSHTQARRGRRPAPVSRCPRQ